MARWISFSFSYYMSGCVSTDENLLRTNGNLFGGVKNPYLESQRLGLADRPGGSALHPPNELYNRYQIP